METRILSNSLNLPSFFSSTKLPKPTSKFACLSFSTKSGRVHVTSDLKQQQQQRSVVKNNNNNKVKLVVNHVHKGSRKLSLLSTDDNTSLCSITHPVIYEPLATSNNQLLLCDCKKGGTALWNPTTDHLKILPKSPFPRPPKVAREYHMYHGLGFHPNSPEDYKVVRFLNFLFEFRCEPPDNDVCEQVELYSLKTDSWKQIAFPPHIFIVDPGDCIHINGFHYWLAFNCKNRVDVIIRFDFANDKFSSSNIPLPQTDKLISHASMLNTYVFVEFEGSLAFLAYSFAHVLGTDEKPFEFEIWVWSDDDESWTRKRVSQIIVPAGSAGVGRPLRLLNNDKLYLEGFMGEMMLFDCGNGRLTSTGLRFDQEGFYGTATIFPYVESSSKENIKHYREILSNPTISISKPAPIVTNSKPNNKLKLLIDHEHEGIRYFSHLSKDDDGNEDLFFNFPNLGNYLRLSAGCNSALLLFEVGLEGSALWNPTTDHVKKLPDIVSPSRCCQVSCYGFGFDPKLAAAASQDHDYKVIRFIKNVNTNDVQVELYSLKTDSLKDITSLYPHSECPPSQPSVHINGFSYWHALESEFSTAFIFSFDFANEKFSSAPHIPLPPPCHNKHGPKFQARHDLRLAEYHGSLAALVYTNVRRHFPYAGHYKVIVEREKPFELEIWVWNNDESASWRKVSGIHVPDVDLEEPLRLIGNDQLYLKGSNGEVWLYDYAKGGELKNLGLKATQISSYLESSFPLNGKKLIRASHKIINH